MITFAYGKLYEDKAALLNRTKRTAASKEKHNREISSVHGEKLINQKMARKVVDEF